MPSPIVRFAKLPNGLRLEYVEQGDASAPAVILLHGLTDSWHSYELVLPHLPHSIRAIALSFRGHGDSDRPDAGYAYADFSEDLVKFMDALGISRAVIAGHSMGRAIAQRFGIDHADRVTGLALVGGFAGDAGNPAIVELETMVSTMTDPMDPEFVRDFQESTLAQPVPPDFLETVIAESLKVPARVWREALRGILDDDVAGLLPNLQAPTLIIAGDRDTFARPSEVAHLAARRIVYPGAGHGVHWEEPERFASDLAAFVADAATEHPVARKRPDA